MKKKISTIKISFDLTSHPAIIENITFNARVELALAIKKLLNEAEKEKWSSIEESK